MLRISVMESSATAVKLRVEGQIAGPWVEELRTTCNAHTGQEPVHLCLELEDVSYADAAGVACLKELREKGIGLFRVSPFLTELFKNDSSPDGC
jgi:ABC-type transporter Mla MlaB component